MYNSDIIIGYRNEYFKKEEEKSITEEIAASSSDILLVAIYSPEKRSF